DGVDSAVHHVDRGLRILDFALAVAACGALWWRRRWPLQLGVATGVAAIVSGGMGGPAAVALFTVAVHRRTGVAFAVGALNVATGVLFAVLRPQHQALWVTAAINV